jgi:hypothetical protein
MKSSRVAERGSRKQARLAEGRNVGEAGVKVMRQGMAGKLCLGIALAMLLIAPASRTQTQGGAGGGEDAGLDSGGYRINQTIEFGYRLNEIGGNIDTYDTFLNLGGGVRLFDYSLDMHSINHQSLFFDELHFSNFGYGGDPNDVSRLRIEKNKWYDFRLLFRRDKNFWDYNLFANPLNPAALNPAGSETTGCIVSPPTAAHPGLPGYCSNPSIAASNSPQALDLTRRMQDYDLTLFPQSRLRFRLGYSRDRNQGAGFFSTDSGGVPDFPEVYSYTTNAYRAGVDYKLFAHTTLSYDQFLIYFKQDNTVTDNPAVDPQNFGYQLANGTPVDLGIVFSTQTPAETLPCAAPITNSATTPPTITSNCNGFLSYSQVGNPRNNIPTERFRFQSNDIKRLALAGSLGYSSSDNTIPDFGEVLNGWVSRTATRVSTTDGPAVAKRVSVNGDLEGTYSITDKLRILDSFRYDNWRIPGVWDTFETNLFGAAASGQVGLALPLSSFTEVSPSAASNFATLCPTAPYNQPGCPLHAAGSGADVTNAISSQFLGQNLRSNTAELEYDFTRRLTAHLGYLYTDRIISQFSATWETGETYFPGGTGATAANDYLAARGDCALVAGALPAGCTLNANGSITAGSPTDLFAEAGNDTARQIITIHENAVLAGIAYRPVDKLRLTGDVEFGYNDNVFTRIDPRQVQAYKLHASYHPRPWATIDGGFEIHENRDNVATVDNLEHDRSYNFSTMLAPRQNLTVGFGYNYWDVFTQSDICFNYSITYTNLAPPPTTLPVSTSPPGVAMASCPIAGASVGAAGLGALSTYASKDHYAHAEVMWKPIKRVTAGLGYGGTFVRGNSIFLNPLAPTGTLDFNYMSPYSFLNFDFGHGFSYKMAWNYYGFNEKGVTNPFGLATIPLQDFDGSNATFSFRYSF